MRFDIITIFPGFFGGFFEHGIVRRAQAEGRVTVNVHDLRNFTHDRHRTVDDRPFGGGEGMVLKPEPLAEALEWLGIRAKAERSGGPGSPENATADPSTASADADSAHDDIGLQSRVILLSAQGRPFSQAAARELARLDRVVLICGRY